MGVLEILTIIFVLLKAFNVIDWSWWVVFLPLFISIVIYITIICLAVFAGWNITWKGRL